MRYHYEPPRYYTHLCGETFECDHPIYDRCTLYKMGSKGLAVIQQRYDEDTKSTTWTEIDPWLVDEIFLNDRFREFFIKYGGLPVKGLYPTVTIRQLMWGLRMKPLPKDIWETVFDRKIV